MATDVILRESFSAPEKLSYGESVSSLYSTNLLYKRFGSPLAFAEVAVTHFPGVGTPGALSTARPAPRRLAPASRLEALCKAYHCPAQGSVSPFLYVTSLGGFSPSEPSFPLRSLCRLSLGREVAVCKPAQMFSPASS